MDYEKKYKEALEWARKVMQGKVGFVLDEVLEKFPELAESEDERIRKALIKYFSEGMEYLSLIPYNKEQCVAWLEKQGEHANFCNKIQIGDKVTRNQDGVLVNLSQLNRVAKPADKQGKHKPADKVEPKFREGDWVVSDDKYVHDDYRVCKITKIVDGRYYIEGGGFLSESSLALYKYRLWTIQDAKDGDVLVTYDGTIVIYQSRCTIDTINVYCCIDNNTFVCGNIGVFDVKGIHPATKEQRDTLMKAITDAGYTFDFEKKELKKIEQKPAWSEEDERKLQLLIVMCDETKGDSVTYSTMYREMEELKTWLKFIKDRVLPQPMQEWSEEDEVAVKDICDKLNRLNMSYVGNESIICQEEIKWLKSLRPQNRWKPSKEQINALSITVKHGCTDDKEALGELLEQLKAL